MPATTSCCAALPLLAPTAGLVALLGAAGALFAREVPYRLLLLREHLAKGAVLGTVLALWTTVVGLSLPELLLLRRVVVSTGMVLARWLLDTVR